MMMRVTRTAARGWSSHAHTSTRVAKICVTKRCFRVADWLMVHCVQSIRCWWPTSVEKLRYTSSRYRRHNTIARFQVKTSPTSVISWSRPDIQLEACCCYCTGNRRILNSGETVWRGQWELRGRPSRAPARGRVAGSRTGAPAISRCSPTCTAWYEYSWGWPVLWSTSLTSVFSGYPFALFPPLSTRRQLQKQPYGRR